MLFFYFLLTAPLFIVIIIIILVKFFQKRCSQMAKSIKDVLKLIEDNGIIAQIGDLL